MQKQDLTRDNEGGGREGIHIPAFATSFNDDLALRPLPDRGSPTCEL